MIWLTRKLGWLLFVAGSLMAFWAALGVLGQCLALLTTGTWRPMAMRLLWVGHPDPQSDLIGLQEILDWFSGFPLFVGTAFIGLCVARLGLKISGGD